MPRTRRLPPAADLRSAAARGAGAALLPVALAASLLGAASGFALQPLRPPPARGSVLGRPSALSPQRGTAPFTGGARALGRARPTGQATRIAPTAVASEPFDPFQVLGVEEGSDVGVIKTAFRRLSLRLHPDVSGSQTSDKFIRLVAAYRALADGAGGRRAGGADQGAAAEAWFLWLWSKMKSPHEERERGPEGRRGRASEVRCSPPAQGAPLYDALEELQCQAQRRAAGGAQPQQPGGGQWDAAVGAGGWRREGGGRKHVMVHGSVPAGGGWAQGAPPGYAGLLSLVRSV